MSNKERCKLFTLPHYSVELYWRIFSYSNKENTKKSRNYFSHKKDEKAY